MRQVATLISRPYLHCTAKRVHTTYSYKVYTFEHFRHCTHARKHARTHTHTHTHTHAHTHTHTHTLDIPVFPETPLCWSLLHLHDQEEAFPLRTTLHLPLLLLRFLGIINMWLQAPLLICCLHCSSTNRFESKGKH